MLIHKYVNKLRLAIPHLQQRASYAGTYDALNYRRPRQSRHGFTIVELLVVIVVIGILASITIVAYTGIQTNARAAVLKSDLQNVPTQIRVYEISHGELPPELSLLDDEKGPATSPGTDYQYKYDNSASPATFCITGVNDSLSYFIVQDGTISEGLCSEHTLPGVAVMPTRAGYVDFSGSYTTTQFTVDPGVAIPVGSWMVIVMAYNEAATTAPPSGWVTLLPRVTTGTLQTVVLARIKDSSDPAIYTVGISSGTNTTTGVLLWGSGAASVADWVVGSAAARSSNATSTTTVSPSIDTTVPNSLVLSIATERTSATETDIVSITGASRWFFVPHPSSIKIQTVTVGYNEQPQPGTVGPVTVTYPNAQTVNALGLQLVIPLAS